MEEGDREGKWVIAFTRLDGVGGLLVGSTFMDLLYTTFNYNTVEKNTLTQGNMYLYKKSTGRSPSALTCVSLPEDAAGDSPVSGTWYNSYCSQIELSVSPSRKVKGVYTSHTGSAGASNVVGWVGTPEHNAKPDDQINGNPVSPNGTPISLGIQWRLINQSKYDMDGSWHWVSTFSGQYHPAQIVRQEDQDDYLLDETLEIFNGLLATATVPEFTDTVPTMWPQTLEFHRTPPSYCRSITPLTSKTCF